MISPCPWTAICPPIWAKPPVLWTGCPLCSILGGGFSIVVSYFAPLLLLSLGLHNFFSVLLKLNQLTLEVYSTLFLCLCTCCLSSIRCPYLVPSMCACQVENLGLYIPSNLRSPCWSFQAVVSMVPWLWIVLICFPSCNLLSNKIFVLAWGNS